jgi:hypothetical protein
LRKAAQVHNVAEDFEESQVHFQGRTVFAAGRKTMRAESGLLMQNPAAGMAVLITRETSPWRRNPSTKSEPVRLTNY